MSAFVRARRHVRHAPEVLESRELMANPAGVLDPTFAGSGSAVVGVSGDILGGYGNPISLAVQPDGKVLVADDEVPGNLPVNEVPDRLVVNRLLTNGTPDVSFGSGGHVSLAMAVAAGGVAVQPDGKIVVAARAQPSGPDAGDSLVIRLDGDGTLDPAFGAAGVVDLKTGTSVAAVAIQADGKVVLAGTLDRGGASANATDFSATRLDADGTLDTSFGSGGVATVAFSIPNAGPAFGSVPASSAEAEAVAIQADGKIVLAGRAVTEYLAGFGSAATTLTAAAVARLDGDGTLDPTFGGASATGRVTLATSLPGSTATPNSAAGGVAIQADGKIVLGVGVHGTPPSPELSDASGEAVAYRLGADGTPDASFGQGGQANLVAIPALANLGGQVDPDGIALALQADGKVVLGFQQSYAVAIGLSEVGRLTASGSVDSAFGDTASPGVASSTIINNAFTAPALALQPDGKILLGGAGRGFAITVARLFPSPAVVPALDLAPDDFDGDGKSDLANYDPDLGAFLIRPSAGGGDITIPFGAAGVGQTIPAVGDYDGALHAEIGAYLPALGIYAYRPANGGPDVVESFGIAGAGQDLPAVGDYTGSGMDDLAIYLPSLGAFAIRPAGGGPDRIIPFGIAGAGRTIPAPGDYDGDGRTDLAAYLPSPGIFAYRPSSGGPDVLVPFGIAGAGQTIPVPGDYDGSGRAEIAAYLPALGLFGYRPAGGGADVLVSFGVAGDGTIPAPGDYDGAGRDDIGIYDPNYGVVAYRPASGPDVLTIFAASGDPTLSIPASTPAFLVATGSGIVRTRSVASVPAVIASSRAVPSGPGAIVSAIRTTRTPVAQATPGTPDPLA